MKTEVIVFGSIDLYEPITVNLGPLGAAVKSCLDFAVGKCDFF